MAPRTQARIARFMVGGTEPVDAELFVRATDLKPDDLDRYSFVLTVTGPGADTWTRQLSKSVTMQRRA